jgi:hypothetical protein
MEGKGRGSEGKGREVRIMRCARVFWVGLGLLGIRVG